jgi:precorrin-6B methylase 2
MKSKKEIKIEKQVQKLASFGLTNKEIAEALAYDENTMKRNFEIFLIKGRANLKQRLKNKQIQVAIGGNVVMLIWLGKQYLDQKDKMEESGGLNINVTRTLLEDKLKNEVINNQQNNRLTDAGN